VGNCSGHTRGMSLVTCSAKCIIASCSGHIFAYFGMVCQFDMLIISNAVGIYHRYYFCSSDMIMPYDVNTFPSGRTVFVLG
jgi:hypothetical protein